MENVFGRLDRIHAIPNSQETSSQRPHVSKWKINESPANIQARFNMARNVDHNVHNSGEGNEETFGKRTNLKGLLHASLEVSSTFSSQAEDPGEKETGQTASSPMPCIARKEATPYQEGEERPHAEGEERPYAFEQSR